MIPIAYQLAAVALSIATAAGTTWLYLDARDDIARLEEQQRTLAGAAASCSESVAAIKERSDESIVAVRNALEANARRLASFDAKATQLLTAKPTVPGDPCKSADSLLRSELSQP